MNRRGFLSLLAPAAALIVAPELLLPKRTFFLPPAGGWGDHPMTATEVLMRNFLAARDAAYRAAYPPVIVLNPAVFRLVNERYGPFPPGGVHYGENKLIAFA